MALVDVDEQYERKRTRKSAPLIDAKISSQFAELQCRESDTQGDKVTKKHGSASDNYIKKLGSSKNYSSKTEIVGAAVTRIEKLKRKTEICKRHVPQLLIRGEHVVSIVLL